MRVGIDARFVTHPQPGGFKTYLHGLIGGLRTQIGAGEFVLYVDRPLPPALGELRDVFTVRVVGGTAPWIGMPWREQVTLTRAVHQDRLDVFHAPCHTAPLRLDTPLVLTVHDMLWASGARVALSRAALLGAYYREVTWRAARAARVVLTVSETSRREILRQLPFLPPERVLVARNAVRQCFTHPVEDAEARTMTARLQLPPQYILALASADPRKNLPGLLRAYARLPEAIRRAHPLVTVWAHPRLANSARGLAAELGITADLRLLFALSDEALAAVYTKAAIFVFPSLAEGFGLPVLEAMGCGAPVLASEDPAVLETAGGAAAVADARRPDVLGAALGALLASPARLETLRAAGLARARDFSWESCARATLHAYEVAAGR